MKYRRKWKGERGREFENALDVAVPCMIVTIFKKKSRGKALQVEASLRPRH